MPFYDPSKVEPREITPGAKIRPVWGDKVMMVFITIEPGGEVPMHTHPHEQMGMVLEGEFQLTIAGETRAVKKGDAYLIPSNVEHRALGSRRRALALDIFSPPREDFKSLYQRV